MTEKRFELNVNQNNQYDIVDLVESKEKNAICIYNDLGNYYFSSAKALCELLNELYEENKELKKDNDIKFWKNELMIQWNTTQIISHELSLAIENGYEISEDFQKYLDELKERHEENVKKIERLKI